jgi:hypothetical protein
MVFMAMLLPTLYSRTILTTEPRTMPMLYRQGVMMGTRSVLDTPAKFIHTRLMGCSACSLSVMPPQFLGNTLCLLLFRMSSLGQPGSRMGISGGMVATCGGGCADDALLCAAPAPPAADSCCSPGAPSSCASASSGCRMGSGSCAANDALTLASSSNRQQPARGTQHETQRRRRRRTSRSGSRSSTTHTMRASKAAAVAVAARSTPGDGP